MIQGKNVIDANNEKNKQCQRLYEQAIANGVVPQIIPVVQRPIKKGTINKHDNRKLDGKTDIEKIRMTVQMFKTSTTAQIKDFAGIGRNKAIAMARILEEQDYLRIETSKGHSTKFVWTGKE